MNFSSLDIERSSPEGPSSFVSNSFLSLCLTVCVLSSFLLNIYSNREKLVDTCSRHFLNASLY